MAYIVYVCDKKDWDMWFTGTPFDVSPKEALTLRDWSKREDCDIAFNLAFFNMNTKVNRANNSVYRTLEYVKGKGYDIGYNGAPNCTSEILEIDWKNKCAGWKLAVKDNVIKCKDTSSKRTRNVNGMTEDGRYIHGQSTGKVTEKALIEYVYNLINNKYNTKVKLLLVQDAGGSTGNYAKRSNIHTAGEKEGTWGRAVVTAACLKYKGEKIKRPLYKGCRGDDVKLLQMIIGGAEIDGIYGNGTYKQVKLAQKNLGFKLKDQDGAAGPMTLSALGLKGW